jgi:RimJ/RimL family protein N-acetyltransferase
MCAVFRDLYTPRLRLRRLKAEDAPAICAYRNLPAVARYQSWDSYTVEDAAQLIAVQAALIVDKPGTWFQLGILFFADQPRIAGRIRVE